MSLSYGINNTVCQEFVVGIQCQEFYICKLLLLKKALFPLNYGQK